MSAEHKEAVRERLLDAAHACLEERGYEAVTTREILERAGLSAGTLYHYFSDKDDLMTALAERVAAVELPMLLEAGEDGDPDRLVELVRSVLAAAAGPSVLPDLRNRARLDRHVRTALSRYDTLLVDGAAPIVERAQLGGAVDPALDASALVELVELVFEGLQTRAAAGMFVTDLDRVVDTFVTVLRKGATS